MLRKLCASEGWSATRHWRSGSRGGEGKVLLGGQSAELPGALDVARAYLEFHILGGLLCDQVERRASAVS